MAQRISSPHPRSSVARLLRPEVAEAAIAPVTLSPTVPPAAHGGSLAFAPHTRHIKREFILSEETDATLNQLLAILETSTGNRLTASQVVRALLITLGECLPMIRPGAENSPRVPRPGNGAGHVRVRLAFERHLAGLIAEGLSGSTARMRGASDREAKPGWGREECPPSSRFSAK